MIYEDYGLLYRKSTGNIATIEIGYCAVILSAMIEVPFFVKDLQQHNLIPEEELELTKSRFLEGKYMSAVDSVCSDFIAFAWLNNLMEMFFKIYPKLNRRLFSHMRKDKPLHPIGTETVCLTVEEVFQELERKVRRRDLEIQNITKQAQKVNIYCRTKEEWDKLPKEVRRKYEPVRYKVSIAGRLEPLNGEYVQQS